LSGVAKTIKAVKISTAVMPYEWILKNFRFLILFPPYHKSYEHTKSIGEKQYLYRMFQCPRVKCHITASLKYKINIFLILFPPYMVQAVVAMLSA